MVSLFTVDSRLYDSASELFYHVTPHSLNQLLPQQKPTKHTVVAQKIKLCIAPL